MFEIGRSFLRPPKLHSWPALSFGQTRFESCAHLVVRQNFPSLNLREPVLNLTQKPIVVLNCALDGFERQRFRRHATSIRRACELGLQFRRHLQFHAPQFSGHQH
jgi:hypothetical protein